MKRLVIALILCASALTLRAPQPAVASDSPIKLDGCSIYNAGTPKWDVRRLSINFKNASDIAADAVTVEIPGVGTYVTHGTFSHGTFVDREYADPVALRNCP